MHPLRKAAAIVGVAESDLVRTPDKTPLQLIAQATKRALDSAGLTLADVDGVTTTNLPGLPALQVAEYLGIQPSFIDSTTLGGSSIEVQLEHTVAAMAAGLCHVTILTFGSTLVSSGGRQHGGYSAHPTFPVDQFDRLYGPLLPISAYAMAARRHMYQYGTTSEQLAEIAVATRKWASMNPVATMRDPITIDDVLNSRMISSPLHLLDCCLVCDGGGAVVVASAERAKSLRKPPVWVLGFGSYHTHVDICSMPDLTSVPAKVSGEKAFRMAGVTHKDIDVAEIYDSFTITVLLTLEDLGFCPKGEGGAFVEGQRTAPGGSFPMNTQGGALSYLHAGPFGIFLLIEAARQLWGECGPRQIQGARTALCNATGGELASVSTIILGSD